VKKMGMKKETKDKTNALIRKSIMSSPFPSKKTFPLIKVPEE
jgi:hypothetical protein